MAEILQRKELPLAPNIYLAIMQGRLVPPPPGLFQCFPSEQWKEEIIRAANVPLNGIEWIYDLHGEGSNPIESESGIEQMRSLAGRSGISVHSLCADYFMDRPILRVAEQDRFVLFHRFCWLIGRCGRLGIKRIVLPFVDKARIETEAEEGTVVAFVEKALPILEKHQVEIHLETSLEPHRFSDLLSRLEHPLVKANYDLGNSASLGYHPREEFNAYGMRVGSVHIKDRVLGGGTVPLGEGAVNFPSVRACLQSVKYSGDFVLQVARGESGQEIDWARTNRKFTLGWWQSTSFSS